MCLRGADGSSSCVGVCGGDCGGGWRANRLLIEMMMVIE